MSDIKILILGFMLSFTIISIHGDFESGYAKVLEEYDKFMSTLEFFQTSLDDVCKELEEYEKVKDSLDTFLATREELCKTKRIPKDCADIKEEFPDSKDGVYRVKPRDGKPSFQVYCDMTEQGGGWLVIQRRQDGSEDFYRTWFEYMDGFGNLTGEFWLGNENIHRLTNQKKYELHVDLQNKSGGTAFAKYSQFLVANMSEFYRLIVGGYSGNAGDKLTYSNETRFSAKNLDFDTSSISCAKNRHGAWWFKNCALVHLNGRYNGGGEAGVYWSSVGNCRRASMKIRPVNCGGLSDNHRGRVEVNFKCPKSIND